MVSSEQDSARVTIPPPLSILMVLVGAWICSTLFPLPIFRFALRGIGYFLIAIGVVTMLWCVSLFRRAKTEIPPWKPTHVLVTEGPYRYSRNPIYLSFLVISFGIVICFNNLIASFLLLAQYLFLRFYVIEREERYLSAKFSEQYQIYSSKVRRWI